MPDDAFEPLLRRSGERLVLLTVTPQPRGLDAGQPDPSVDSNIQRVAVDDGADGHRFGRHDALRRSYRSSHQRENAQNLHDITLLQRVTGDADVPVQSSSPVLHRPPLAEAQWPRRRRDRSRRSRQRHAGSRRPEAGSRKLEAASRQPAAGS
jgi:hypothetical protein